MSLFILDTEMVSFSSTALATLAVNMKSLGSSVSKYDTSNDAGLDFASVAAKIAANIEAGSIKIQNTSELINSVIDAHSALQNSMVFEKSTETVEDASQVSTVPTAVGTAMAASLYNSHFSRVEATKSLQTASSINEAILEKHSNSLEESKKKDTTSSISQKLLAVQLANKKATTNKSVYDMASEVIDGKWGNGSERRKRLTDAGYNYDIVQKMVNYKLGMASEPPKLSIEEIAQEVLEGKWGKGEEYLSKVEEAGYDSTEVEKAVLKLLDELSPKLNDN